MEREKLPPEVLVDPGRIQENYITLSGHIAYWCTLHADASFEVHQAKDALKAAEAAAYLEASESRWRIFDAGMTKQRPTEKVVESIARQSESVINAQAKLAAYQRERDRISAIVQALEAKASMLITLGADRRTELKHLNVEVKE